MIGPATANLPLALRTLALTATVVPVADYVFVPAPPKANAALARRNQNTRYASLRAAGAETQHGKAHRARLRRVRPSPTCMYARSAT